MQKNGKLKTRITRVAIVLAALSLSGCSFLTSMFKSVENEAVVIVEAPPTSVPTTTVVVPEPTQLPPIAIVLTSGQPAYADVARELTRHFENYKIYDLSEGNRPPVAILRLINDSDTGAVVAIGLRAAQSSVAMSDSPVVFSQVFNYQDHNLVTEHSRGVATIAPLDAQIAAWMQADPTITRIGAIIGPGHEDLIAEAGRAAERNGIELLIRVARSDQETLYNFRRMIRDIDGFLLFPDNRILSRRALLQIMEDAKRQRVPVLVTNESMLKIGASISISSVASNIAKTITDVIRQIQAGNIGRVPSITPLSEIRVRTIDTVQVVDR